MKNTGCAKNKGYDAGKKISSIKRHIITDVLGFPHAITVTTANITNRNGAVEVITKDIHVAVGNAGFQQVIISF